VFSVRDRIITLRLSGNEAAAPSAILFLTLPYHTEQITAIFLNKCLLTSQSSNI